MKKIYVKKQVYGKLVDGKLVLAPRVLRLPDGTIVSNPREKHYRAAGYLPVFDEPPTGVPAGKHAVARGYEIVDDAIRRVYEIVDDPPPPPRTFSKLKVVAALTEAGVWEQVKAWIEEKGLYDLYLAAQEFAEDNEYFTQGLTALKPIVGWTDEQVEELLSQCVKEGV